MQLLKRVAHDQLILPRCAAQQAQVHKLDSYEYTRPWCGNSKFKVWALLMGTGHDPSIGAPQTHADTGQRRQGRRARRHNTGATGRRESTEASSRPAATSSLKASNGQRQATADCSSILRGPRSHSPSWPTRAGKKKDLPPRRCRSRSRSSRPCSQWTTPAKHGKVAEWGRAIGRRRGVGCGRDRCTWSWSARVSACQCNVGVDAHFLHENLQNQCTGDVRGIYVARAMRRRMSRHFRAKDAWHDYGMIGI